MQDTAASTARRRVSRVMQHCSGTIASPASTSAFRYSLDSAETEGILTRAQRAFYEENGYIVITAAEANCADDDEGLTMLLAANPDTAGLAGVVTSCAQAAGMCGMVPEGLNPCPVTCGVCEPAAPDRSLAHPALDPLWSAAQDLGMAAVLHIGGVRGELKHGWWFNGGDASNYAILQLVNTGTAPQIALAALLIEGVFERHPGLVVLVEELGISWLPHFLETIDSVTVGRYGEQFGMGAGDYRLPLRPSEYMRRQVRVSPLVSADRLRPTLDLLPPELLVFSSDYPHQEGRSQAVKLFDQELGELDASRREQFFSASIAELMDL